jgi:hypothetical protein
MNKLKLVVAVIFLSLSVVSCSDNKEEIITKPTESKTYTNLPALQTTDYSQTPPVTSGSFTKFSFKTGAIVTDDSWDIAFRGTTILVNGGSQIGGITEEPQRSGNAALTIETGTFDGITLAPNDASFSQDAVGSYALPTGSNNGWYTYAGPPTHLINPITGKVIVIRTNDGHYAKMEIISYYKDNKPTEAENARYYTFNYVYNPNKGDKNIQ